METKNKNNSYIEKLKKPQWQKKRLEVLELANWCCESCGEGDKTLHVHHKVYHRGHEPWEYEAFELACLCESCHGYATKIMASFNASIEAFKSYSDGVADIERATGYLNGLRGTGLGAPDITVDSYEEAFGVSDAVGRGCTPEDVIGALNGHVLKIGDFVKAIVKRRRSDAT